MKVTAFFDEMLLLETGNRKQEQWVLLEQNRVTLAFLFVLARAVVQAICVVPQQLLPGM